MLENCNTIPYNQSKRRINQVLSLLKEHSTVFSVQLTQKRSKKFILYLFFKFLSGSGSETNNVESGSRKRKSYGFGSGFTTKLLHHKKFQKEELNKFT